MRQPSGLWLGINIGGEALQECRRQNSKPRGMYGGTFGGSRWKKEMLHGRGWGGELWVVRAVWTAVGGKSRSMNSILQAVMNHGPFQGRAWKRFEHRQEDQQGL